MSKKYPGSGPPMEIGPYNPGSEISVPAPDLEAENARLQARLKATEKDKMIWYRYYTKHHECPLVEVEQERDGYKARDKLRGEVLEELVLFFQSGNEVPVTRAVINANSEWVAKARAAVAATPDEARERKKDD